MKTRFPHHPGGFTLIEISMVMALIIGLTAAIGFGVSSVHQWQKAKDGSLALQAVYAAQRSYLADHPTADIASVTASQLTGYLPQGWTTLPTATGLDGETLTVDYSVMPPRLVLGSTLYDPSTTHSDGLWDVGE